MIDIKNAVDRFLGWKLPEHFNPDGGISFVRDYNQNTQYPAKHEPIGTNLFTADQAREMFEYCLQDGLKTIDAHEFMKSIDPKSDTFFVLDGLASAVRMMATRYVMWRTLAWVAFIGNIVQYFASSWMK